MEVLDDGNMLKFYMQVIKIDSVDNLVLKNIKKTMLKFWCVCMCKIHVL